MNGERGVEPVPGERLKFRFPGERRGCRARLVAREGDRWRVVLDPSFPVPAHPDAVRVQFRRSDAAYEREGCLVSLPAGGTASPGAKGNERIFLVTGAPPRRLQRREYFRLRVRLPFMVETVIEPPSAEPSQPRSLRLMDLSAGGCCCQDPDGALRRGHLYRARLMLSAGGSLILHARVVRRARTRQGEVAGLHFPDLRDSERERIMSTLFEEYRRQRRRRLETLNQSLEPQLPVG